MKRRYWWAWNSHLDEGRMAYLEGKKGRVGMVRVEVRPAALKRQRKRSNGLR